MRKPDELLQLVSSGRIDDDGTVVNELLSAFHSGYPLERLRPLLKSRDDKVVRDAAFIASELGERAKPFLPESYRLLSHPNKWVRSDALDVVLTCATGRDGEVVAKAISLLRDKEKGVRWQASLFLARISEEQLLAAFDYLCENTPESPYRDNLAALMRGCAGDYALIINMIHNTDSMTRLFGVAGAGRIMSHNKRPLECALSSDDPEVRGIAQSLRKNPPLTR